MEQANNTGLSVSYWYNPAGIRIGKADNGVTTNYTVDSNRDYAQVIVEEVNGTEVNYLYGHDLVSQTVNNATRFYHYDGLGSTRILSDEAGSLTDSYDYDAFGTVLNESGTTDNNYLFTGEQYDANLDQYYLRARYYNQSIGRFTQMDTWMGSNQDPITLHKYLYANADPVMYTDPSGYMSMASVGAGMNGMAVLSTSIRIGASMGSRYISRTFVAVASMGLQSIKSEIKRCSRSRGSKCRIPNLVVIGSATHIESQSHIADAQLGKGSNGIFISPVVTYRQGANKSRSWLRYTNECHVKPPGTDCDEYPFAASDNGEKMRYRSYQVSLRPISSFDNQSSGRLWGRAVRNMNGKKFIIDQYGTFSFYLKNGKFGL